MITREEFYINSTDEIHMIHGFRWFDPEKKIKGILQMVHGMLEYIERYDELACCMAEQGYFVIGHDHLGHGDSVKNLSELGCVEDRGDVWWLKDVEQIRRMGASYAPNVPYIMMGHSMGSFLVRRYLIYNGKKLDGAVIMGTGQQPAALVKAGLLLVYAQKLHKGPNGRSKLLDLMTCGGYVKRYPDNSKTGSWLSRDPQVIIRAIQDKKSNFKFSLNAYEAMFHTIEEIVNPKRAAKMPKELPILIMSGEDDPVGEMGKGIARFEAMLQKLGMKDVVCKMYPEDRHELIHELDKEQVFKDLLNWCDSVVMDQ